MLTQSLLSAIPFLTAMGAVGLITAMAYKVRKTKAVAEVSQTTAFIDPVGAAGVLESATQENTGPAAGELMQNNAESRGLRAETTWEARSISFGDGLRGELSGNVMDEANQKDAANSILTTHVKTEHAHVGGILTTSIENTSKPIIAGILATHVKTERTPTRTGTIVTVDGITSVRFVESGKVYPLCPTPIPDDVTTVMPVSILNASWSDLSKLNRH